MPFNWWAIHALELCATCTMEWALGTELPQEGTKYTGGGAGTNQEDKLNKRNISLWWFSRFPLIRLLGRCSYASLASGQNSVRICRLSMPKFIFVTLPFRSFLGVEMTSLEAVAPYWTSMLKAVEDVVRLQMQVQPEF